jgi:hypothetical protein
MGSACMTGLTSCRSFWPSPQSLGQPEHPTLLAQCDRSRGERTHQAVIVVADQVDVLARQDFGCPRGGRFAGSGERAIQDQCPRCEGFDVLSNVDGPIARRVLRAFGIIHLFPGCQPFTCHRAASLTISGLPCEEGVVVSINATVQGWSRLVSRLLGESKAGADCSFATAGRSRAT